MLKRIFNYIKVILLFIIFLPTIIIIVKYTKPSER